MPPVHLPFRVDRTGDSGGCAAPPNLRSGAPPNSPPRPLPPRQLPKYSKYYESDDESRYGCGYGSDRGYDSDDGMCGFTRAQCDELLSQGVKPWEDDAGAVLSALSGDSYYF